jgi:hypothetical protein
MKRAISSLPTLASISPSTVCEAANSVHFSDWLSRQGPVAGTRRPHAMLATLLALYRMEKSARRIRLFPNG